MALHPPSSCRARLSRPHRSNCSCRRRHSPPCGPLPTECSCVRPGPSTPLSDKLRPSEAESLGSPADSTTAPPSPSAISEIGLCGTCGKPAGDGARMRPLKRGRAALACAPCFAAYRRRRTKTETASRARRRAKGLCWHCSEPAKPSRSLCGFHLLCVRRRRPASALFDDLLGACRAMGFPKRRLRKIERILGRLRQGAAKFGVYPALWRAPRSGLGTTRAAAGRCPG